MLFVEIRIDICTDIRIDLRSPGASLLLFRLGEIHH